MVRFFVILWLIVAGGWVPAYAHGGHDERIKVKFADKTLILEAHVPGSMLASFDADHDNQLTTAEFRSAANKIRSVFAQHVNVMDETGLLLEPAFYDTPISVGDISAPDAPVEFVRLYMRYPQVEKSVALKFDLFRGQPKNLILFNSEGSWQKTLQDGVVELWLN